MSAAPEAAPLPIPDLARPRLPGLLRLANALGAPLAPRWVRLDEASLCAAARDATGLADFGDPGFREPLGVLLASLEGEARLSAFGRFATRQLLVQLLTSRLRLEALYREHPEIEQERIAAPIVIAGLPRTGTTHLLNLFGADPALRTLPYWESLEPLPVPGEAPAPDGRDPRRLRCERSLRFLERVMPLFPAMHEFSVEGPHEEIQLLAMQFATQLFEASYHVPAYAAWYRDTDQTPAYAYLERVLKALQWLRGPRRWALKSPQHLENLGPLQTVFPDARVIQTHRDPVRVLASLATMIAYGRRMQTRADAVDPVAIGRHWAQRLEDMLRASLRDRPRLPAAQVLDVHFQQLVAEPWPTLEAVYAFADLPLDATARAALARHLEAHPRGRHGAVRYELAALGLDETALRPRLAFYAEHFGVPREPGA